MDRTWLSNRTAIAGIGATEFSKDSGRSEMQLAVEAIHAALRDAGLAPEDVDGLVSYTVDGNAETEIARNLGIPALTFFSRVGFGGGAAGAVVQQAAMAVVTGVARTVVVYRALNERSGNRFGAGLHDNRKSVSPGPSAGEAAVFGWYLPFGLVTPAAWVAMCATRYMHEFGATSEDFGRVAVAARRHAATNPAAWFHGKPISLADHQASRWIVEPLHLLDCCQESDGAVALVVVAAERARDLRRPPAFITAAAQGSGPDQQVMTSYYRESIVGLPEAGIVARQLWEMSGLRPRDIRTAILYDHFTPFVLVQLEEFGFCARGEAKDFVQDGNIELGGGLPLNPHGGQLGEAYIHGMNGVAEAVRQIRGTAVNQIADVAHVLVTAGTGVPTSGLILGRG
jgi:acetyl-CoA acetyltransferase